MLFQVRYIKIFDFLKKKEINNSLGADKDKLPWNRFPEITRRMLTCAMINFFESNEYKNNPISDNIIEVFTSHENSIIARIRKNTFVQILSELISLRLIKTLENSNDLIPFSKDYKRIFEPTDSQKDWLLSLTTASKNKLKNEFGSILKKKIKPELKIIKSNHSIKSFLKLFIPFSSLLKDEIGKPSLFHSSIDFSYQFLGDVPFPKKQKLDISEEAEEEDDDDENDEENEDESEESKESKEGSKELEEELEEPYINESNSSSKSPKYSKEIINSKINSQNKSDLKLKKITENNEKNINDQKDSQDLAPWQIQKAQNALQKLRNYKSPNLEINKRRI